MKGVKRYSTLLWEFYKGNQDSFNYFQNELIPCKRFPICQNKLELPISWLYYGLFWWFSLIGVVPFQRFVSFFMKLAVMKLIL